ncbi:MAG: TldD/PmbA family protein [Candidatus Hodarchaeales archaeon]|jgi:predicted Zn-dependent protease
MEFNKNLMMEKCALVLDEAEKLGASQAEVAADLVNVSLTRLANSIIDQNVSEKHFTLRMNLYYGKKKGSIRVEIINKDMIKQAVEKAAKIAKISPEIKDFVSIVRPKKYSDRLKTGDLVSKGTIEATPEQRAEYAKIVLDKAHEIDKRIKAVAGSISNVINERLVMNTLGIKVYEVRTSSNINLTVLGNDGKEETAGWSTDSRRDISKLKVADVAGRAARKAADGFGAKLIEPGEYEIILEPAAVGGLLYFLSYIGFNAMSYQEYRSFLRDKIGEQVFSQKLNLWSDPLDKRHVNASRFDYEGTPTRRTDLVSNGVVKGLIYDTLTATRDGVESTGHNVYSPFMKFSFPRLSHVFIREGDSSIDEMIKETRNGILVTHFHYQNTVNPVKGILTGLTRDGTWLIKNGEIVSPLKTLRYTDALPRFLSNIDLLGKYPDNQLVNSISLLDDDTSFVPSMKLPSFRISGSTKQ